MLKFKTPIDAEQCYMNNAPLLCMQNALFALHLLLE